MQVKENSDKGMDKGMDLREVAMAQIYVAFGQGTGEIRVSREACAALGAQVKAQLDIMIKGWDTDAVQILERIRAIGRGARQLAVSRYDTVISGKDVETAAPRVKEVSATPFCPTDDPGR